jgi:hypothetical protein
LSVHNSLYDSIEWLSHARNNVSKDISYPTPPHRVWAPVKLGIDLGGVFSKGPEQANFFARDEDRDIVQPLSTLSPPHAQSEEANSLARRLPSRMGSVESFRLRVKLLNLQGRI